MTRRDERGAATIEVALFVPVLVLILLVAVFGGRLVEANADVHAAARDAARSASLRADPAAAEAAALERAEATLAARRQACLSHRVAVDLGRFGPGGTVAVEVTCVVPLADLGFPGLPSARSVTDRFVVPIDPLAVRR